MAQNLAFLDFAHGVKYKIGEKFHHGVNVKNLKKKRTCLTGIGHATRGSFLIYLTHLPHLLLTARVAGAAWIAV